MPLVPAMPMKPAVAEPATPMKEGKEQGVDFIGIKSVDYGTPQQTLL